MKTRSVETGDMVLIDTGFKVRDYQSDITQATSGPVSELHRKCGMPRIRAGRRICRRAVGTPCGEVDRMRRSLEADGFSPAISCRYSSARHGIGFLSTNGCLCQTRH